MYIIKFDLLLLARIVCTFQLLLKEASSGNKYRNSKRKENELTFFTSEEISHNSNENIHIVGIIYTYRYNTC